MKRDERWEEVSAEIGRAWHDVYDEETGEWSTFFVMRVLIETRWGGKVWYYRQDIPEKTWDEVIENNNEAFGFVMQEMVDIIDEYLDGKRT